MNVETNYWVVAGCSVGSIAWKMNLERPAQSGSGDVESYSSEKNTRQQQGIEQFNGLLFNL